MANTLYPQLLSFTLYSSGATLGDTTVVLSTFKSIDGVQLSMTDFGDKGFMTLEPGAGSDEEQISFTGVTLNSNGTTTLTGVKNVLHLSPYTETSGLAKSHSGGSKAVVAITSGLLNQFANKGNAETVTGKFTFPSSEAARPVGAADTDTAVLEAYVTFGQLGRTSFSGTVNASTIAKGIVEEATQAEIDADTAAGSTAARLFTNPSTLVTSKYGRGLAAFGGYAADGGSTDAYAITLSPAIAAYTVGQAITFKAATRNTGAATLNINSVGAQAIVKDVSTALDTGDIKAGQMVTVVWDGTNFQMVTTNGPTPTGAVLPFAGRTSPAGYLLCDGSAVSRTTYAALFSVTSPTLGTFTITIAAPGLATLASHGLATGDSVYFTTTGALPTGLTANTRYWVVKNDANSFWLSTTLANALAGTKITTSGSQSGVHTSVLTPYGLGDGSTTFNVPNLKSSVPVGLDQAATEFAGLGQTGGEKTHTLITAEMPAHTHDTAAGGPNGSGGTVSYSGANQGALAVTSTSTGGGGSHNNLQPYVTMNYIIKV